MVSSRASRRVELGAWLVLPEPFIAEAASRMGFDFVTLDLQHGLVGEDCALSMLQAIELGGAVPTVRAASISPAHIGRMLDYGAVNLIVPMIESVAEAEAVVRACRYAPKGKRSFGPTRVSLQYENYFETGPSKIRVFPMIETMSALQVVDQIAALDGVSGLFVGPADLSLSIGLKPGRDHADPAFASAIDSVLAACRKHGKTAGIQADRATMAKRIAQGFKFLTVCLDSANVCEIFAQSLKEARSLL